MLAEAERKGVRLIQSDLKELELEETFDAAIMMFAVLGYQLTNDDVDAALRAAHRHLRPGALLIFDCWYGPAVLAQKPSDRTIVVDTSNGPITRRSTATLDVCRRVCNVTFHIDPDLTETHTVRYFFADEILRFVKSAGFDLLRFGAFPEFDRDPGPDTWNVMAVARS
jgi:SAM-dependent methyltransferase